MGFKGRFFVVLSKVKYGEKKLLFQPQSGFFYNYFVHIFALLRNSFGNTTSIIFYGNLLTKI